MFITAASSIQTFLKFLLCASFPDRCQGLHELPTHLWGGISFVRECEGVPDMFIRGDFIEALQVLRKLTNSNWDKGMKTFHPQVPKLEVWQPKRD